MPSRRAYLATLAAAGLAGCIGEIPGANESPSDSPTATTAPGTAARPDVTVGAAAVQYSYRHIEQVDWNGIQRADGQFVFVTVDAREADSPPGPEAFSLVADEEAYEPTELEHSMPVTVDVPGRAYSVGDEHSEDRGWLAFETPAELAAAPSLRMERDSVPATWELDTEKATAPPPAWEWSADAPATVAPESTFEISVTAENVGDGSGTFRGAVNFSYPMYMPKPVEITLAPGASGIDTVPAEVRDAEDGKEIEYGVRTPTGETTVSVTVDAGTATPE